ncbi:MAG: hypothetical protein UX04_C0003G0065 [Microgenomates group bacterium GW2011_GWF2_45_18]|nr:MAG: hypothetical protein UW18_C0002G0065 [Microgenomates group bacterium GW2011_GWF1_44_10]KKU01793.1 MAG: hypothetical protein UX04_C0003G0065 [Microgenomates group bacterium GW2011_GWF2_45_18]OGJ41270.1 MAG: hypothetical protein A2378_04225 [Candidatus Pacebacteria bacterium RIFOXYB1_FULL_44_10]HAU98903.1 hypothetical protein [Candidatus Paceibacterota bacterium]HAX01140.1 hypothetical protein [Candidatus Paceibacterota bacterium]
MTSTFHFDSYELKEDRQTIAFFYHLQLEDATHNFVETLQLHAPIPVSYSQKLLKNYLLSLHLALGISYWKLTCSNSVLVHSGELSDQQAEFWNTTYGIGLGEFYYKNQIDFRAIKPFIGTHVAQSFASNTQPKPEKYLIGIGGGKDSLVTLEVMKQHALPFDSFIVDSGFLFSHPLHTVSEHLQSQLYVNRHLDPSLFQLNSLGTYYNGHIPVSMIFAFIGTFVASAFGYSAFVVSNEASSNEGNVQYLGFEINHQWSKSTTFEKLFQQYLTTFGEQTSRYFSFLRPLNDLQISALFSQMTQYHAVSTSCNQAFRITNTTTPVRWCKSCAKCVFTYLMMKPFLTPDQRNTLFDGSFPIERNSDLIAQLRGEKDTKPFDCVGTPEEVVQAMRLANHQTLSSTEVLSYGEESLIPTPLREIVREAHKQAISIIQKATL